MAASTREEKKGDDDVIAYADFYTTLKKLTEEQQALLKAAYDERKKHIGGGEDLTYHDLELLRLIKTREEEVAKAQDEAEKRLREEKKDVIGEQIAEARRNTGREKREELRKRDEKNPELREKIKGIKKLQSNIIQNCASLRIKLPDGKIVLVAKQSKGDQGAEERTSNHSEPALVAAALDDIITRHKELVEEAKKFRGSNRGWIARELANPADFPTASQRDLNKIKEDGYILEYLLNQPGVKFEFYTERAPCHRGGEAGHGCDRFLDTLFDSQQKVYYSIPNTKGTVRVAMCDLLIDRLEARREFRKAKKREENKSEEEILKDKLKVLKEEQQRVDEEISKIRKALEARGINIENQLKKTPSKSSAREQRRQKSTGIVTVYDLKKQLKKQKELAKGSAELELKIYLNNLWEEGNEREREIVKNSGQMIINFFNNYCQDQKTVGFPTTLVEEIKKLINDATPETITEEMLLRLVPPEIKEEKTEATDLSSTIDVPASPSSMRDVSRGSGVIVSSSSQPSITISNSSGLSEIARAEEALINALAKQKYYYELASNRERGYLEPV